MLQTTSPSFGTGIYLGPGDSTVVNAGHITAAYAGIYNRNGGTIDIRNSGVIIGETIVSNYGYSAGIWV